MTGNFLTMIGSALITFYTANAGFFLSTGRGILATFVILRLAFIGLMSWGGALDEWNFIKEMGLILVTLLVMSWYDTSLFGGPTFPHVIIDEAKELSDRLEGSAGTQATAKLNAAVAQIEMPTSKGWVPTASDLIAVVGYLVLEVFIGVEKILILVSLAATYIALGVVTMVGPLFIPFLLFPGLESLAWGWLHSMFKYAFMQVVAAAIVFLNSNVLLMFFTVHPSPWKSEDFVPLAIEFGIVVAGAIYVIGWIPDISNSVTGGYASSNTVIRSRSI